MSTSKITDTTIERIRPNTVTVNSNMKARYMQRSPTKILAKVEAIGVKNLRPQRPVKADPTVKKMPQVQMRC